MSEYTHRSVRKEQRMPAREVERAGMGIAIFLLGYLFGIGTMHWALSTPLGF